MIIISETSYTMQNIFIYIWRVQKGFQRSRLFASVSGVVAVLCSVLELGSLFTLNHGGHRGQSCKTCQPALLVLTALQVASSYDVAFIKKNWRRRKNKKDQKEQQKTKRTKKSEKRRKEKKRNQTKLKEKKPKQTKNKQKQTNEKKRNETKRNKK